MRAKLLQRHVHGDGRVSTKYKSTDVLLFVAVISVIKFRKQVFVGFYHHHYQAVHNVLVC